MQNDYERFLAYRAVQRQLTAKFASPRLLLLHVAAFILTMTAIWVYGGAWGLWFYRDNYIAPVVIGAAWSLILAGHALLHYRRSAASPTQREQAVENEMRTFIAQNREALSSETLIELHQTMESKLAGRGNWSVSLLAFALVNALSWTVSVFNIGSSWPFQMTPIFAVVIMGGFQAYLTWQQQRDAGRQTWLTRFPLRHAFIYLLATVILGLLGMLRAVNPWDVNTLVELGLLTLIAHSVWNIVLQPIIAWLQRQPGQTDKRKTAYALALGDDGELMAADETEADFYEDAGTQQMNRRN